MADESNKGALPLPKGKFDVIYADPPWEYGGTQFYGRDGKTGEAKSHYNTMSLKQLKELDVPSIAAKDCLLFLWVSSPLMDVALDVAKHWGFTYATVAFCWNKGEMDTNPGHYTQSQIELCLVFKKGKIPANRGERGVRQMITARRGKHSSKPLEAKERIARMFPTHKKIELFARLAFGEDWSHWGNEVKVAENQPLLLGM